MKAHYRTRNGRMTFEVESESQKGIFRGIAELQAVFEADWKCGCCDSDDIRFDVRDVEDNEYFALRCMACNAKLSFGQHRKGNTLFAKRKDEQNNLLPNRGWSVYQGKQERPDDRQGLASAPRGRMQ